MSQGSEDVISLAANDEHKESESTKNKFFEPNEVVAFSVVDS